MMGTDNIHYVNKTNMKPPFPTGYKQIVFGMGCFWGAEKCFWDLEGVYTTAVGYTAGHTTDPGYQEVCSGLTGHNEVVLVVYDEKKITLNQLLAIFWQSHNPTQGMRQGNDRGTQYRSGIYTEDDEQLQSAIESQKAYQSILHQNKHPDITTEIKKVDTFYYAEDYHQQYLAKNPNGYCGLGGIGLDFPSKAY